MRDYYRMRQPQHGADFNEIRRVARVGAAVSVEPGQPWWADRLASLHHAYRDACDTLAWLTTAASPSNGHGGRDAVAAWGGSRTSRGPP